MKYIIPLSIAIILCCLPPSSLANSEAPTVNKKVCVQVIDNKTKKKVTKCRTIKVQQKHQGKKIPKSKQ